MDVTSYNKPIFKFLLLLLVGWMVLNQASRYNEVGLILYYSVSRDIVQVPEQKKRDIVQVEVSRFIFFCQGGV